MRRLAVIGAASAAAIVLTGALAISGPNEASAANTQRLAATVLPTPTPNPDDILDGVDDLVDDILDEVDIPGTNINICLSVSVRVGDLIDELKLEKNAADKVREALKDDGDLLDLRAKCKTTSTRPSSSSTTTRTVVRVVPRPYGKGCGTQVRVCPNSDTGIEAGGDRAMPGDVVIG